MHKHPYAWPTLGAQFPADQVWPLPEHNDHAAVQGRVLNEAAIHTETMRPTALKRR